MPRYRIPNAKFTAKDKHKFIPEGEKEVHLLHAADCIFIDTVYLPGYGPEPEPEEVSSEITEVVREVVKAPKPKKKSKKKTAKKKASKKRG